MKITRYILPVIVGAMTGMILITLGETLLRNQFPLPPGAEKNRQLLEAALSAMPDKAYLALLVNYLICSFFAGMVATLVAGRTTARPMLVVGIVLTLAGLLNVINLPQRLWFAVTNLLVYIPGAWLGYIAVKKEKEVAATK
jgi:hypothetical protein